jgi:hypothetical protein
MLKIIIGVLASVATALALAVPAMAAVTVPQAFTGYHAEGPIRIQGENQCLTATHIGGDTWVLSIFTCDNGPGQLWETLVINRVAHISLLGHPNIVVSGLPGSRDAVELVDTSTFPNGELPFNRTVYIGGSLKSPSVNKLSNVKRSYVAAPQRGRTLVWVGYFLPRSAHRGLIFGGTGWIAETVE